MVTMTAITREITEMVALLPETEQSLAYEFVKRMVLAWEAEFTKLTPSERSELDNAFADNERYSVDDIDWG